MQKFLLNVSQGQVIKRNALASRKIQCTLNLFVVHLSKPQKLYIHRYERRCEEEQRSAKNGKNKKLQPLPCSGDELYLRSTLYISIKISIA